MLRLKVIEGTTCFAEHARHDVACQRQACKNWMHYPNANNCVMIAVEKKGKHTLQEIGDLLGLTRMRVCQLEKEIIKKIRTLNVIQ